MLRHGTSPVGGSRRRARLATVIASIGLLATVSGCGLLSGEDDSSSSEGNGSVEKSDITVATLPAIDVAPLHLAVKNGYFKEEGLNVKIDQAASGQAALTKLISGDADITFSSYVPFLVAQNKGAADIKFVADAVSTTPDSIQIVTMPNSSVKNVKQLQGKKVAVSALNTISDAMVKSVMKTNGLDPNSVNFVPVSFPDMAATLSRGDVDAALMIEPFLTQASSSTGTVPLVDAATGPTKDFPLAGYGALTKFTEENPETVAAFQRAMKKATDEAQDRSKVEKMVTEYSKVEADTAALLKLPKFQSTLDAARIQRVADLMTEFGIIPEKMDVAPMIAKQAVT
ncbi:ABC transporter substrate-binding protein [Prauserella muralis]|uniref:Sulfonate ABC transporter substrate-binding protein n=1 Tax=Prauserella muralis TaxID=588067 RepID=A0A2V4B7A2_9PSEU|nr:ABC transporter substrate-binding protein [Prauserella muralis]PXY31001.1 sulfonate ABC transporter substrate-binding protein [Prauserella muralis]TWE14733.1 NitT/TauT family transport system substrate-binding protein [Prauserella muralis]